MSVSTFILSELYKGGLSYGAELQRRFEAATIPSWEGVHHSSVYRALARLLEKGFVFRFREEGARRNRKFYGISKRGRRHFGSLIAGELSEPRTYRNPLNIAVQCLSTMKAEGAVALLKARRQRLAALEAKADEVARSARLADQSGNRASSYERLAAERILMKTRAELFFAGSLADLLEGSG